MLLFPDKNVKLTLPYDKKQHLIACFSKKNINCQKFFVGETASSNCIL